MTLPLQVTELELLVLIASGELTGKTLRVTEAHAEGCAGEPCICRREFLIEAMEDRP